MKNKQLPLLLILSLLFFVSCKQTKQEEKEDKNIVNITVLQLNDVYEMSPVSGGKLGGLARVQTLLKELKAENPNTFTVLSGDMLSPSAIGTAKIKKEGEEKEQKIAGAQMVDVLNEMNWDFFMLGNHEFDLKEPELRARLSEMKFKVISDNVLDTSGAMFPNTQTNLQFEVEGVKIGLLGITLDKNTGGYAIISPAFEAAEKAVKELKNKGSNIIIALTHQVLIDDINMAAEIADIDIIMGGHEHENFKLLRGDDFTPITKADANAKTVFVHKLSYNKMSKKLDIASELVFIDDQIKEDPAIAQVVNKWTELAFNSFRKMGYEPADTICISDKVLDGTEAAVRNRATELTNLITRGFLSAYPTADASIMNGGTVRIDDKLQPGPITQYDILKISPFGGSISLVSMNGETLVKALIEGQENIGAGGFLQYANISKVNEEWMINEKPVEPTKVYKIAITSYIVERKDNGYALLGYKSNHVQKTAAPKHQFVKVVIDQFRKEFPSE
ncbi:MAG: bifunctional metallophosphatase/5'-nucleotidase [Flavobacteriales bacterium]|nr:bifunctional metallophosphatase/5'-nucleotidase [Flavobacteriales bacterium]